MNKKIEEIEEHNTKNESKNFFRKIKIQNTEYKPKLSACKNKNGEIISEEIKVIERWAEYFKELLNEERETQTDTYVSYVTAQPFTEVPSLEEVKITIDKMHNGKAPGEDSITSELFKNGGPILYKEMHELITMV